MKTSLLFLSIVLLATQGPLPDASISGRLNDVNSANNLLGGLQGTLIRASIGTIGYRDGRRIFVISNGMAQLDAAGAFQFQNVKAGEYYLRVETPVAGGMAMYYPGTLDVDAATRITVAAGQELVGIDVDADMGRSFKISGTVLNIPDAAKANGLPNGILGFTFVPTDPRSLDTGSPLVRSTSASAGGEFEITLPAGEWDIFPVVPARIAGTPPSAGRPAPPAPPNAPAYATGRARVQLRDRNVENVAITVTSTDVKGRIVGPAGSLPENITGPYPIRVGLAPKDNYPPALITHVRTLRTTGPGGEFSFIGVPPGRYTFQISSIPADLYLADIRVGTKSVYEDGVLTVGMGPIDPVELILRRGGGTVRAIPIGPPAADTISSRIALIPVDRRENVLLYQTVLARIDPFDIRSVAPGRYKVFAFHNLPEGGAEQNSEFMAPYENFGMTVDVAAGQTVEVQVPWIRSGK